MKHILLSLVFEDVEDLLVTGGLGVDPVVPMSVIQLQSVSALSPSVLKWHDTPTFFF